MGTVDNKQKTTVDDSSLKEAIKVQLFWEGHKNLRNLPYGFDVV